MKKYWLIGLYALALTSCDSFLNCEPENSFSSEGFLESESDLRLYTNGFLQSFLPSEETIAWGGDQYADFCATRSSTTFLIGDTWDDTQQGGWGTGDWGDLRQINYFLDNLPNAKGKVTDAIYLHNEGVGRFWRAYFYYGMVRTFGDVPWYETTLDVDNRDELYKPRDKREVVMDKILEDLDFACTNCSTDKTLTESSTLITKWVALALKSRICLFEGTYRKYHTELGLQSSAEKFLRASITASEELMTKGPYKLLNTGDVETQYRSLFTSEELNTPEFKAELQQVVDKLRETVLKDFSSMRRFCYENGGKIPGGWSQNYGYVVETEHYEYCLRCNPVQGDYQAYLSCYDLNEQKINHAYQPLVGRVHFINGDAQQFTDATAYLDCIREELPHEATTGFRFRTITQDPAVRKAVDDIVFDLYGEENLCSEEDYNLAPSEEIQMDGM